jgi:hypothetical protein
LRSTEAHDSVLTHRHDGNTMKHGPGSLTPNNGDAR